MITRKTEDYSELFKQASLALNITDPDDQISSLNEYFANIEELAAKSLQYTVLPLDEETFIIHADTRTVDIPPTFKAGVGVKGDQVAEIIYFEIDRYFDAIDLNTQNIYIEWETRTQKGLSKEYWRDLTTKENKIIFGWPLTNDITENVGPVKFSVRFYTIKENEDQTKEIVYSFNTQPATILINESINMDLLDDSILRLEDDVIDMIKQRFQNSELTGSNSVAPPPEFLDNILDQEADLDPTTGLYTMIAQAWGSGNITYYLEKWSDQEKKFVKVASNDLFYKPTTDTEKIPEEERDKEIYYIWKETENPEEQGTTIGGWVVYTGTLPDSNPEGPNQIFEAYGKYDVDAIGKYRIIAQNRVGQAKNTLASGVVTIPGPTMPAIKKGPFSVYLETDADGSNPAAVLRAQPAEGVEDPAYGGALSYSWTKIGSVQPLEFVGSECPVQEEGTYNLIVTNTRNRGSISTDNISYRVTHHAQVPVLLAPVADTNVDLGTILRCIVDVDAVPRDNIYIRWYKDITVGDAPNPEVDTPCTEKEERVDETGIAEFIPTTGGRYYAVITLNRNNEAKSLISPVWSVY